VIGNDVVDIVKSRIESDWKRPGFIEKIFTTDEQLLIKESPDQERCVWLLWSMKEAAYKIYNRQTKIRGFIPKKLHCTIDAYVGTAYTGKVAYSQIIYYTSTQITTSYIHTIAVSRHSDFANVIEIENIGVIKDSFGIPHLQTTEGKLKDVSISHHGQFEKVITLV